ncbi:MAG: hypothetical protein ACYSWU_27080, partial [Planctomycetota bacterium]
LMTSGTFTRQLGEDPGEVQYDHDGGWAAKGAPLTVTLTVAGTPNGAILRDDNRDNSFDNERLMLGWYEATHVVELTNPIVINDGTMRVQSYNNPNTDQDVGKLSGDISGTGGTQRMYLEGEGGADTQEGTLWLTGNNSYTEIRVDDGALRAADGVGLPTGALLRLRADNDEYANGILESWGTFARNVGTAAGQVVLSDQNNGGFAAWDDGSKTYDDPSTPALECLTVTLNGGADLSIDDTWGTTGDDKILVGSRTANAMTTLTNNLTMHVATTDDTEFHVFDNPHSDQDVFRITGVITGANDLEIDDVDANIQGGVLWLDPRVDPSDPSSAPTPNLFTDIFNIEQGILRAADGFGMPATSYVQFDSSGGGRISIWESWDADQNDPTTGIRRPGDVSGAGGLDWGDYGGGFAAWSGHLTVALDDGAPQSRDAGSNSFLDGEDEFQLNSHSADNVVTFVNDINLEGTMQVKVWDNPFQTTDWAVLSGVLTNGTLWKTGPGRLDITGDNTVGLTVDEGTLNATGDNAISTLTVNAGEVNMSGDDTIDTVVVNDGDVTFGGVKDLGTVDLLGGSLLATVGTALGDASTAITVDGGSLGLEAGSASASATITTSGATVYAGPGAVLTLTPPALSTVGGDVVKEGPGTVNLENHPIGGNVTVNEGTLGVGLNILSYYLPGADTLSVGTDATFAFAGTVNRKVVSTGSGATLVV